MTKTKSNRVISTLCILMVMSMFIACASIFVSADNADTGFDLYFNTDANYTDARYKTDSTSCYMNYETGNITYTAFACGKETDSEFDSSLYDRSGGFVYRFTSAHEKRFMYNYVWEKAHDPAQMVYPIAPCISISASANGYGTASGKWSPDSIYQAGVLPPSDYMQ